MKSTLQGLAVGVLLLTSACAGLARAAADSARLPAPTDSLEVTWTSPGTNAAGSMPLGNGDISVNAWAETNGDLLLYIGKSDSWDGNGRLLKLGRLRLHFLNHPFAAANPGGGRVPPSCRRQHGGLRAGSSRPVTGRA